MVLHSFKSSFRVSCGKGIFGAISRTMNENGYDRKPEPAYEK